MIRRYAVEIYSGIAAGLLVGAMLLALSAVGANKAASLMVPVLVTFGFLFVILATAAANVRQRGLYRRR